MIIKFRSDNLDPVVRKIMDYVKDKEDWFVIDLKKAKIFRSLNQNRYYWGVVLKILADETGYTSDEMHQLMARKFLSYQTSGNTFVLSTAKLNTFEFEQYTAKIREWAKDMLLTIPLPNEITEEIYMQVSNLREEY